MASSQFQFRKKVWNGNKVGQQYAIWLPDSDTQSDRGAETCTCHSSREAAVAEEKVPNLLKEPAQRATPARQNWKRCRKGALVKDL